MRNLSPQELKPLLDRKEVTLLDVRQAEELDIARIEGAVHIPLNELPARLGELDPAQPVVAMCHHGVRSEMAGRVLERNGFAQVAHLSGGIDAWSQAVDPSIPRY
ncbi:MAG TPA: rhodanese-like domain-containing protein [Nevskia sp.]|nr:rhodanese-like domain-containing protein [Nevskia sp.]